MLLKNIGGQRYGFIDGWISEAGWRQESAGNEDCWSGTAAGQNKEWKWTVEKPGETKEALKTAIKDNEAILIDVIIDSEEALPMLPPGAGINEMIGEYKLEKDVI